MNVLGFCSISALDRPLGAAAELAAAAGFDALEVTARPPHLDPEAGTAAAREQGRIVREAGLEVVAYGSYLGRFEQTEARHAKREVALAAALETSLLRVWAEPAAADPADLEPTLAWLIPACDAAASEGITVVVERHLGSFADTPERIAALFDRVDRPNLALNYQVLDALPQERVAAQAADCRELVGRAQYFHLKNYRAPDDGGPLLPGGSLEAGVLDYRAILAAAHDGGYAGPLTLEFLSWDPIPAEEKVARDIAYLRKVLAEVRATAAAEAVS
jgi:sugar phosphate isomerase/epimerase